MESITLDYQKHVIEKHLPLVMAKLDINLTGTHYTIIEHEKTKKRGKDHIGRYKMCDTEIKLTQYDSKEEKMEHMEGLHWNQDDAYRMETIKGGEIPEELRNTKKAVTKKL